MATSGTQFAGLAAETAASAPSAGFLGWSGDADRTVYTMLGGPVNRGAYATTTAYAVGDVVTYQGVQYRAAQAVLATNTIPPAVGAVWSDASNKRGPVEVSGSHVQHYR